MWYTYLIVGLMLIVSGIAKAIQDKISFHHHKSVFKNASIFWNPLESWKLKYKDNDFEKGEKFPGSSTVFVSLTDAWHLFGMIRNFILVSAISVAANNYWFLLGYIIFAGTFHLFYTYVFKSNN